MTTLQSNFNDYPVLRFGPKPAVEAHRVAYQRAPQRSGDMAVPPATS